MTGPDVLPRQVAREDELLDELEVLEDLKKDLLLARKREEGGE